MSDKYVFDDGSGLERRFYRSLRDSIMGNYRTPKTIEDIIDMLRMFRIKTKRNKYFFWYISNIRFKPPKSPHEIAWTTPDKIVVLCKNDGQEDFSNSSWFFIFIHECLHQFFGTFDVGDTIRQNEDIFGKYDHTMLNIASDCVINETIQAKGIGDWTELNQKVGLITAQALRDQYKVDYDVRSDTQLTLYTRLMEAVKKNPSLKDKMPQSWEDQIDKHDEGNPEDSEIDEQTKEGTENGDGRDDDGSPMDENGENGKDGNDDTDEKGENGKDGNDDTDEKGENGKRNGKGDNTKQTKGRGGQITLTPEQQEVLKGFEPKTKEEIEEKIKEAAGNLGDLLAPVKYAKDEVKNARKILAQSESVGNYMEKMTDFVIKKTARLSRTINEREDSYQRLNRRNSPLKSGAYEPTIVKAGEREKDPEAQSIQITYWVDTSGSMGNEKIKNVFNMLYSLESALIKKFQKGAVKEIGFTYFGWDDKVHPTKPPRIPELGEGTMDLDKLLKEVRDLSKTNIDVILTDGDLGVNIRDVQNILGVGSGKQTGVKSKKDVQKERYYCVVHEIISNKGTMKAFESLEKVTNGVVVAIPAPHDGLGAVFNEDLPKQVAGSGIPQKRSSYSDL